MDENITNSLQHLNSEFGIDFYVAPTLLRLYGDFPTLVVEESLRYPSVPYFSTSGDLSRTTDVT